MTERHHRQPGYVTTFYSYKGGVGRTFLLANVAWLLARWGRKVLCLDWDLEAPGLHRFLAPFAARGPGVLDIVQGFSGTSPASWQDCLVEVQGPWGGDGCLHLIRAGRGDDAYIQSVQALDWKALSDSGLESFLERLRGEWVEPGAYDHVLIDSRTGITDVGGICAAQLPDLLVLTFTASLQSLEGAVDVAGRASRSRERMPIDRGGFNVLPVPCRIHVGEEDRLEQEWMSRFADVLEPLLKPWRERKVQTLEYLPHLRVKEQARWSFGEQLPVRTESLDDPARISYAFANVAALVDQRLHESGMIARQRQGYILRSAGPVGMDKPSAETSPDFDVFISYPSETRNTAAALAEALGKLGLRPYIDVDSLEVGSDWSRVLYAARESIDAFAVLLTGDALEGRPQWDEILHILRREEESDVQVIPVFLDDGAAGAAPTSLKKLFGLRLDSNDGVEGVALKIAGQLLPKRIEKSRALKDSNGELAALLNLATVTYGLGDTSKVESYLRDALDLAQRISNRSSEGKTLSLLGQIALDTHRFDEAREYYGQAEELARVSADQKLEARSLDRLGLIATLMSKIEEGIVYHAQSLSLYREIGDREGEALELSRLGTAYAHAGKPDEAMDFFKRLLAISREVGNRSTEAFALNSLADTWRDLGQYEKALDLYKQSLVIAREIGERSSEGVTLANMGNIYQALEQLEPAEDNFEHALVIARERGDQSGEARALDSLGTVYAKLGDTTKAIAAYEQVLVLYRKMSSRGGEAAVLVKLAAAYQEVGQVERSRSLYQRAKVAGEQIGDKHLVSSIVEALQQLDAASDSDHH